MSTRPIFKQWVYLFMIPLLAFLDSHQRKVYGIGAQNFIRGTYTSIYEKRGMVIKIRKLCPP